MYKKLCVVYLFLVGMLEGEEGYSIEGGVLFLGIDEQANRVRKEEKTSHLT